MKNTVVLLIVLTAAFAAPVAGYRAASAHRSYKAELTRHAALKRQERALDAYTEQVREYRQFAARVERFIVTAQAAGVAEDGWNRHQLDVKNRVVSFTELAQLIDDASGGDSYYFLPHRLQIHSPGAGVFANPFIRAGGRTTAGAVRVSMSGEYLVPVQ